MSDCEEKIYSNDYVDFIISKDVLDVIDLSSDCIQRIDEEKDTYFYPRSFFRIFDFPADSYASVPKCYGLLDGDIKITAAAGTRTERAGRDDRIYRYRDRLPKSGISVF